MLTANRQIYNSNRVIKLSKKRLIPVSGVRKLSPEEQQKKFVDTLYAKCTDGFIEIRHQKNNIITGRAWIPVTAIAIPSQPIDENIYIGVATRQEGKGTKDALIQIPAVWVDVDFNGISEAVAKKRLNEFKLKPSIHVHSGHGWHLYWVWGAPAGSNDIPKIEEINKALAYYFDGDSAAVDASRILRLPGTQNVKYTYPRSATLIHSDASRLYQFSDFDFLPKGSPPIQPAILGTQSETLKGVPEGQRHNKAVRLAGHYLGKRIQLDEVFDILWDWNKKNQPPIPDQELQYTIENVYRNYHSGISTAADDNNYVSINDIIENGGISLTDLIARHFEPNPILLEPWLREGETVLITAPRGVGKTWLGLSIGLALTYDLKIDGWETKKHVGVVYVDGEMNAYRLQTRMIDMIKRNPTPKAPFKIYSSDILARESKDSPCISSKEWRDGYYNFLKKHREYKVIIFDNLGSLVYGIDENNKRDWDDINKFMISLRSLDVTSVMIHHTGKSGDQRGTSAREDNIDTSMKLIRPKGYTSGDGCKFIVEFTKNRNFYGSDADSCCLRLKLTTQGLVWETENPRQEKKEQIIAMLGQGMKQNEIANAVECKAPYVTQVKKEAIKTGILDHQGGFTEAGRNKYGDREIELIMEND